MYLGDFPMIADSMYSSVGKTKQTHTNLIASMGAGTNWEKHNSWGCPNYGESGEMEV